MQTEADKQIEKAKESIQEAIDALTAVTLTRDALGWEDYSPAYRVRMW